MGSESEVVTVEVRLYPTSIFAAVKRDINRTAETYNPQLARISVSEDIPWSDTMLTKIPAKKLVERELESSPIGNGLSPLARLAIALTRSTRPQVPEAPSKEFTDTIDSRTAINKTEALYSETAPSCRCA